MKLFGSKDTNHRHPVDFDEALAEMLHNKRPLGPVNEFAPRNEFGQRRLAPPPPPPEPPVEHVDTFLGLPLEALDEDMAKYTAAHEEAKARHQEIRDLIMKIRRDEQARMERDRKALELHNKMVATLTSEIRALYQPPAIVDEPAQEHTDGEQTQEPDGAERAA